MFLFTLVSLKRVSTPNDNIDPDFFFFAMISLAGGMMDRGGNNGKTFRIYQASEK